MAEQWPFKPLVKSSTLFALTRALLYGCLLYTSDAADERSSVDLGGRRIIKQKKKRTKKEKKKTNKQKPHKITTTRDRHTHK